VKGILASGALPGGSELVDASLTGNALQSYDAIWVLACILQNSGVDGVGSLDLARDLLRAELEGCGLTGASGSVRFEGTDRVWDGARLIVRSFANEAAATRAEANATTPAWSNTELSSDQVGPIVAYWSADLGLVLSGDVEPLVWRNGLLYPETPGRAAGPPPSEARGVASIVLPVVAAAVVAAVLLIAAVLGRSGVVKGYVIYLDRRNKQKGPPIRRGAPLTVVITDVENSTALWDQYPEAMNVGLDMHNQCLRSHLKPWFGYELLTEGDSFRVAFHTSQDALGWCVACQEDLDRLPWPHELDTQAITFRAPTIPVRAFAEGAAIPQAQKSLRGQRNAEALLAMYGSRSSRSPEAPGGWGHRSSHLSDAPAHRRSSMSSVGSIHSEPGIPTVGVSALSSLAPHGDSPDEGGEGTDRDRKRPPPVAASSDRYPNGSFYEASGSGSSPEGDPSPGTPVSVSTPASSFLSPVRAFSKALAKAATLGDRARPGQHSAQFRGLRVRMGVHSGSVQQVAVHENTKRPVYRGFDLEIAKYICDAARGGQVIP